MTTSTLFHRTIGTEVTTAVVFSKRADATPAGPDDPGIVECEVQQPDGTRTVYTYNPGVIVRDGLGEYHLDLATDQAGQWRVEWRGTGGGPIVTYDTAFYVDASTLTPEPV